MCDLRLGGTFSVSVSPVQDSQGSVIGSVHVARNITPLKKAEGELRRAGKELELRVEQRTENSGQRTNDSISKSENDKKPRMRYASAKNDSAPSARALGTSYSSRTCVTAILT